MKGRRRKRARKIRKVSVYVMSFFGLSAEEETNTNMNSLALTSQC